MSKNNGRFLCRETDTYENGDRAITDTFVLDNGELQYHIYNVSADGSEHSHQITDEDGEHVYAREINDEHPWHELDRTFSVKWLKELSLTEQKSILNLMSKKDLELVKNLILSDEICYNEDYSKKLCR